MDSVRSAALGFWIGTGSGFEDADRAGLSHLLEHMLFRGTARYESLEIDQIFDGMGAEINAGTGKETTSVYSRVLDVHLERAFDVMADMVWRPRIADEDLAQEREIVLEEIAMYEDDPQDRVFDVLGEAVFGDHPLGRAIIGHARGGGRHAGRRAARVPRRPLRRPERRGRRRRARSTTTASSSSSRRRSATRRPVGAPPAPLALPGGRSGAAGASSPRRPSSTTWRSARPASPATTIAASRCAILDTRARRDVVVAAVPGGARAARPGLLGVLVHRVLRGHGPGRPLPRHAARQRRRRR